MDPDGETAHAVCNAHVLHNLQEIVELEQEPGRLGGAYAATAA